MVVVSSNIMYQCNVFYIGSCAPTENKRGVEALQEPLKDRYRGNVSNVEGYDVTVTVMPEVVNVKYAGDVLPEFSLPISTLSICAAVRCVDSHGDSNMKFIPVHSVITANEPDSEHPALFATVMRRSSDKSQPLECHTFIGNSTRDALHLVNATQTAHTALRRGYSPTNAMKFFIDQSTEFDRTIRVQSTKGSSNYGGVKTDTKKIYTYSEDYDVRDHNTEARTYVTHVNDAESTHYDRVSKVYNGSNVVLNGESHHDTKTYYNGYNGSNVVLNGDSHHESKTYYVKAGDVELPPVQRAAESETIFVGLNVEEQQRPPTPQQQTIIVDKPIIKEAPPPEPPKINVIERPVYIDPPKREPIKPQTIIVDKPIMGKYEEIVIPEPKIIEREVFIKAPPAPVMQAQRIIVDKPICEDYPPMPAYPPPIIQENPVYIKAPPYPEQKAQRIIIDKPVMMAPGPPPPAPPPEIEVREVPVDPPEYPPQKAHRIVVEQPKFNKPKPAPPPPAPIIETKDVYIDPPPYPQQERQKIIVERPIIRNPEAPPRAPPPEIIEKPVYVEMPKYPHQEPQRIVVEKCIVRDIGPPPPPPPPIIIEKIKYIDPPPWPVQEPQRIVIEKPVFRRQAPPPQVKPIIIEKPVEVNYPAPPPQRAQRIIVERPSVRATTYGVSQTRRIPSTYSYTQQQQYAQPANVGRASYVVRREGSPRGLRRTAWSENGDDRGQSRWDYNDQTGGYRVYGQPRDFRRTENQFINERGFARRINNEEVQVRPGPGSYSGYRYTQRRGSVSS